MEANPRQAPRADQFNTRKSLDQTQAGLRYQRRMSERDELTLTAYHGERHTTQYQSFREGTTAQSCHPGGVIVLERKYQGIDTRWKHEDTFASLPVTLIGGLDYETMTERRQGFENFILRDGTVDYGEKGDQRRNEKNRIWNLDHLQTSWQLTPHWTLDAGLRYSTVSFDSTDYYITPRNGDDSGSKRYHQWLPMGSLNYKISPAWNVYLSAGRGFETPPPPSSPTVPTARGLNIGLQPSTSDTVELGSKLRLGNGLVSAALFQTDTDNELVVAESNTHQLRQRRQNPAARPGAGAGSRVRAGLAPAYGLDAAGRHLPQRNVRQSRLYPRRQSPAGHRAQHGLRLAGLCAAGRLACRRGAALHERHSGQRRQQRAGPAYTVAGVNAGYRFTWNRWALDVFSRVDNVFDRRYVGSVIVNEGNGRYFEPAPGRNWGGGATLSYRFE